MNLKLTEVVSDMNGKTGMEMIRRPRAPTRYRAPWPPSCWCWGNGAWVQRTLQMPEALSDHLAVREDCDDPQRPPLTPGAACHIQCKNALQQSCPAPAGQARRRRGQGVAAKSQGTAGLTRPHDYFDLKGTRWAASQRCIAGRRGGGGTGNA